MRPSLLLTGGVSGLLQSVLHMEVVLGMSFSDHGTQQSPMLQQLLAHAERYGTVISHTALVSCPDTSKCCALLINCDARYVLPTHVLAVTLHISV